MNTNIENFYNNESVRQLEYENFLLAEAYSKDLIALNRDDVYAESRLQMRIEEAELTQEYESFNWKL